MSSKGERNKPFVATLTKDQQIERLVEQRNRLLQIIDGFNPFAECDYDFEDTSEEIDNIVEHLVEPEVTYSGDTIKVCFPKLKEYALNLLGAAERMRVDALEVVGNLYMDEGANPLTEDVGGDEPELEIYRRVVDP